MSIIGCDLHTRYQVVAWIEEGTGEIKVRQLEHEGEDVRKLYAQFPHYISPRVTHFPISLSAV